MVQYLEDSLYLQRTSVWFPVSTSGGSQMPVTLDLGNPILSSSFQDTCTHLHTYPHTDI